jgi:uncharacterized BrkB/YihY/UPF0761 family membrane protein
MAKSISPTRQAWAAFLISSAFIIGTLLPVIQYGHIFLYFPAFLLFGCDSARSTSDCLRIEFSPFVPIALAILALIACRLAIRKTWYLGSVLTGAALCAASWVFFLRAFN